MSTSEAVDHTMRPAAAMRPFLMPFGGLWINGVDCGEGDPLLLIMGLGGSVEMWEPLIKHLHGRRIIAFDAPGTGRSSVPMAAITVPKLADIAAAVLAQHDIETADVLGFSYGGAVAQQMAVQHPRRVRRLILAATTCGVGTQPAADAQASAALASPWRYYSTNYFKRTAAPIYGGLVGRDADVRERLARSRSIHPPHPYGYFLQLAGAAGWSSLNFLAAIAQPTLVLLGDEDPLIPVGAAQQVADGIASSTLVVLEGAGHLLLLDEPERSGPAIENYLTNHPPP